MGDAAGGYFCFGVGLAWDADVDGGGGGAGAFDGGADGWEVGVVGVLWLK